MKKKKKKENLENRTLKKYTIKYFYKELDIFIEFISYKLMVCLIIIF